MRSFIFWLIIRSAVFVLLDEVAIHDWQTSVAFCAVFTIFDAMNTIERRNNRSIP